MSREQAFKRAFENLSRGFQRSKATVHTVPAVTPRRYLTRRAVKREVT